METSTVFHPGFEAPTWLVKAVRQQIMEIIPAMRYGTLYTVKDMCGDEFWETLTVGQQRTAGKIAVQLVNLGQVPLTPGPFKKASPYPKKYLLRS